MENWWDILGVEQGADLRTVKRAYAAKLKTIRQDEDPQGFMKVREAYDIAQHYVQSEQDETFQPSENPVHENPTHNSPARESIHLSEFDPPALESVPPVETDEIFEVGAAAPQPENPGNAELVEILTAKSEALIQNKEKRDKIVAWREIFEQLHDLNVDEYAHFERSLQYILSRHAHEIIVSGTRRNRKGHRIRPTVMRGATGRYIFDHFSWNSPQHPEVYSEDMMGLRGLLNAHSSSTKKELEHKAKEDQKAFDKTGQGMDTGTIVILVIGGITALRYLLKFLGIEL